MNYQELFAAVQKRPGMYGLDGSFKQFCIFLLGCDAGTSWSLLTGFREWLIMRCNDGNNLVWMALILWLAFPKDRHSKYKVRPGLEPIPTLTDEANPVAVETLFRLLDEFLELRQQPRGLPKIFSDYADWLKDYSAHIDQAILYEQSDQEEQS